LISTITSKAIWYLQKNTTWKEAIAVVTDANIAHLIMRTYRSKKGPSSSPAAGNREKSPKDPADTPSFFERIYELVRLIPKGRVTTYGALAEASGLKITARMAGWAMYAADRAQPPIPAHRVVNSSGVLSGKDHFSTPTLMQELLEQEGIIVKKDKIQDFKTVFWDPAEGKKSNRKKTTRQQP
jgi:methylated-DNA-protein-cysteine methyltransferase-like protein